MSSTDNGLTRDHLMHELDASWNELLSYLGSLTEEQLTVPTDAAGWTAKDHVIHLAAWETAALAMLEGKSKRETLDITQEIWDQDDDPVNAVIQQRYHDMPWTEVSKTLHHNHDLILKKLNSMTEEDFQRPRSFYDGSGQQRPIIDFVNWDTVGHYRDHMPWIKAIVDKA